MEVREQTSRSQEELVDYALKLMDNQIATLEITDYRQRDDLNNVRQDVTLFKGELHYFVKYLDKITGPDEDIEIMPISDLIYKYAYGFSPKVNAINVSDDSLDFIIKSSVGSA